MNPFAILGLAIVDFLGSACLGYFWGASGAVLFFHWRGMLRPGPVLRRYLWVRRRVWLAYVVWAPVRLLVEADPKDLVIYGALTGLAWWLSRKLDDNDWMKKLIEKGLGAVERFGNRLRVVVPPPAGA